MLVLSRRVGERILIGDQIAVTIVRVTGGGVRVGIEAPPDMAVLRAEIKAAAGTASGERGSASPPTSAAPSASASTGSVVAKPIVAASVDPPSEIPPVRKPR